MKVIANRNWMRLQAPDLAMARDVLRLVITAVLAGTGFALLLALAVLSLTVIAPPVHASGGSVQSLPALDATQPASGAESGVAPSAGVQRENVALQTPPAVAPQTLGEPNPSGARPLMSSLAGWPLLLALLAGGGALIAYLRRKA